MGSGELARRFSHCFHKTWATVWDARRMRILLIRQRMGLARVILLLVALAGSMAGGAFGQAPVTPEPPKTILLIRHAEKPESGMDLAPAGFERAKVLAKLFDGSAAPHNLPRPDFLFATHVSKNSNRPVETITPLSAALNEPISHEIADKEFARRWLTAVAEREVRREGGAGGVASRVAARAGEGAGSYAAV